MTTLETCPACAGFLPPAASACPHCGVACAAPGGGLGRKLLTAASGGVIALTLMACYGVGPDYECVDSDGDGYFTEGSCGDGGLVDCDDTNPDIHPGADDPEADGIDQNCDGVDGVAPDTTSGASTGAESSSTTDASATDASTTDASTTDASTTDASTTA